MKERKTRRSHTNSRDGMLFLYLLNFFFAEIKKLGKHYGLRKKKTANNKNLSTLFTIPTTNDQSRKSIMLLFRMI